MKKYLMSIILCLSLGCSEEPAEPIPGDVLPIEKMTDIMLDVQLIEGGIVIRKYNKMQRKGQISDYYKSLYHKHKVSKDTFESSLKYYTDHPDKLETIYDGILERLSKLEAEVQNEKPDTSASAK